LEEGYFFGSFLLRLTADLSMEEEVASGKYMVERGNGCREGLNSGSKKNTGKREFPIAKKGVQKKTW
jgi:hypothetical protein